MDGSIAATASLRMRDQLRSAFHAPAGGADAGLFEELLRMPVAQSHSRSDEQSQPAVDDVLAQAPVSGASSETSATKPEGERDDETEADDEPIAQADQASLSALPQVQPIPTQDISAQPTLPSGEEPEAAAVVTDQPQENGAVADQDQQASTASVQPVVNDTQPQPDAVDVPEAVVPAVDAEQAGASAPEADGVQLASAAAESTAPPEAAQVPVAETRESGSEVSDGPPRRRGRATDASDTNGQDASTGVPAVGLHEAQASSQSQAQDAPAGPSGSDERATAQPSDAAQTEASEIPTQAVTQQESGKRSDAGDRREKWFARDDDGPRADDSEGAAASSGEDRSEAEMLTPSPAETATASADIFTAPDAAAAATAVAAPSMADAAALASVVAQQNGASSSASGRGDSSVGTHAVGQMTGGRGNGAASASSQSAGTAATDPGNEGVAGMSQQERVRLVQRVARSFSRLGPDGGQVTLKLHPPQLGVLNMLVKIEGQTMTARLQTETTAARDVILENLPVLRERLAEQGIEVESFRVEVASERDMSADSQSQPQNPHSGESSGDSRSSSRGVDYRRLARSSHSMQTADAAMRSNESARWSTQLPNGRSLDLRA